MNITVPPFQEMIDALDRAPANTEDAAANAMAVYLQAAANMDALKSVQARAKAVIEEIIIETGSDKWESDFARCYVTKPSVTVSYDRKAIDALIASDDNLNRLLSPHRKETERAGTLTIRRK